MDNSDKMKFMVFRFPENPEEFGIYMVTEPEYRIDDNNQYEYLGLGPMCRVYTGSGVFTGPDAAQRFNALQVMMTTRATGELYHPTWGTGQACLTELEMKQESRSDYIRYSFTFRGVDEKGSIPRLPGLEAQHTK